MAKGAPLWLKLVLYISVLLTLIIFMLALFRQQLPWWNCPVAQITKSKLRKDQSYSTRIVVCGLMRDAAAQVPKLRQSLSLWLSYFQDAKIVIVENDSVDGTRDLLLNWAKEDPRVVVLGASHLPRAQHATVYRNTSMARIKKMCFIRNIYLEWLKQSSCRDWEFTLVMDMDLELEQKGDELVKRANWLLKIKDVDALAAHTMSPLAGQHLWTYYDTFAWQDSSRPTTMCEHLLPSWFRWNRYKILDQPTPVSVRSAFGGLVLYKTRTLVGTRYTTRYNSVHDGADCEHISIHRKLRMMFDPTWWVMAVHS